MPGFEVIGSEELANIEEIFSESGGVLFAHGFAERRKGRFRVREFEAALARKFGAKHCQAVTSGTAAQFVAMKVMGIKPGDEIITQAFTFVATIEAIRECGATPIVVDVDETLNMSPAALEKAITPKTKAIVPVHMLGNPASLSEILAIGEKNNVPVLEDACEALGSTYAGKAIGTHGKVGFFSLDFGKTITSGEGGFILTDDSEIYARMAAYHDHGHYNDPGVPRGKDLAMLSGFNFRMTELQAAVGLAQLKKLDFIVDKNRENKARLKQALGVLEGKIQFRRITDSGELGDTLILFLPEKTHADRVVQKLVEVGVGTKNVPDAMQWHFAPNWGHLWADHPQYAKNFSTVWAKSQSLLERCIALPVMVNWEPAFVDAMAEKVIHAVRSVV